MMDKFTKLNSLFWFLGLLSIICFYFIADNKVQTLISRNKVMEDSLNRLQKDIRTLDSLLKIHPVIDSNGMPDAAFDTVLVKRNGNEYLYRFIPKEKKADSYEWNFGDGRKSSDTKVEHSFDTEKSTVFLVTLNVKKGQKKNQGILTLVFQAPLRISIKLDSSSFCRQNTGRYKFKLNPEGGTVKGFGVIFDKKSKDYFFIPSAKDVKAGKITFTYEFSGITKNLQVEIKECQDTVKPVIRLEKREFCIQDSLKYKFNVWPAGCKISGPGVLTEKGVYYFCPSKSITGNVVIECNYNGKKATMDIKINNCDKVKKYNKK